MSNLKNYIYLILAMLFWGVSYIFTAQMLEVLQPVFIVFCRSVIASVFFFVYCYASYGKKMFIKKEFILVFVALTLFEPFLYYIFETYSLKDVSPSIVAVIISTIPLFVAITGTLIYKERLTKLNFFGILISISGIVIILYDQLAKISSTWLGILFAFGAVLSAIGYTFFAKKIPEQYSPTIVITWQNIIGMIGFFPLVLIMNRDFPITQQWNILCNAPEYMLYIVLLAIFCSALAFIFYYNGLRTIGLARSAIFTNLIPVVTLAVSYFGFAEEVSIYKLLGVIVVIAGVVLVQINANKA